MKYEKWNLYAAAVLAAVGILGGCGAKNAETQAQPQNAQASTQENTEAESTQANAAESKAETEKNGNLSVNYVKFPLNVPSIVEQD